MSSEKGDFNIAMIQNLEPGWEQEWERIVLLLVSGESEFTSDENSMERGRLYQACRRVANASPHDFTASIEDFTMWVLIRMSERVREQKLFQNYHPEKGSVLDFLCSASYLKKCFRGFHHRESPRLYNAYFVESSSNGVSAQEEMSKEQIEDTRGPSMKQHWATVETLQYKVEEKNRTTVKVLQYDVADTREPSVDEREFQESWAQFENKILGEGPLVIHCPPQGTRIYQQAGLQLYPKLSQEDVEMIAIHESLRNDVAKSLEISDSEANDTVEESHRSSQVRWKRKAEKYYVSLKKDRFRKEATREQCEKQLSEITFRRYFCPIVTQEIVRLLSLPDNNASQCLKRYREELKNLLQDYDAEYQFIESTRPKERTNPQRTR